MFEITRVMEQELCTASPTHSNTHALVSCHTDTSTLDAALRTLVLSFVSGTSSAIKPLLSLTLLVPFSSGQCGMTNIIIHSRKLAELEFEWLLRSTIK